MSLHDDVLFNLNAGIRSQLSGPAEPTPHKPRGWIEASAGGTRGHDEGDDYSLSEYSVCYLIEFTSEAGNHFELGVGPAYSRTVLDLAAENLSIDQFGVHLQLKFTVDLTRDWSGFARVGVTPLLIDGGQDQEELGVSWRASKSVSLNAGYRWWHFHDENLDDAATTVGSIDVYARGPAIGITVFL